MLFYFFFAAYLPQQFHQQKLWKYQTWQLPHSGTLMILLWTGSATNVLRTINMVALEIFPFLKKYIMLILTLLMAAFGKAERLYIS